MSRMARDHTSLARGSYRESCASIKAQYAVPPTHLDFLRTRVVERATCALDPTAVRTELTEAKVDHDWSSSIVDEDIRSLEVFVADTEQVEAVDGVTQSANEGDELGPGPRCADA